MHKPNDNLKHKQRYNQNHFLRSIIFIFFTCTTILLSNPSFSQAPNVVSITPGANETNVVINKVIDIEFDRAINVNNSSANITFFNMDDGFSTIHQFDMTDPEVIVSGVNLLINLDTYEDWPTNTNISMRIDHDAITSWSGLLNHPFQIENDERPYLVSTSPTFGANEVSTISDLVLNFNESISVDPSRFIQIKTHSNGATFLNIQLNDPSVTVSGSQITITNIPFTFETEYRIEISGFTSIVDASGYGFLDLNPSSPEPTWTFTTVESTPPEVVTLTPADNATGVSYSGQEFTITFNESIGGLGYVIIRESDGTEFEEFQPGDLTFGSNSISFTPENDFEPGESYYINYSSVGDLEGSLSSNNTSTFWNFTVEPATPPKVVSLSPANESLEVDVASNLVIVYDQPVFLQDNGATPRIRILEQGGNLVESYDLPSTNVTGIGTSTITINPTNNLEDDTKYYVTVTDAFEDDQGFIADNLGDPTDWTFDTGKPPGLVSLSPITGTSNVSALSNFVLTFDEPVNAGVVSVITFRKVSDGSFVTDVRDMDNQITGYGTNTITLNPADPLPLDEEMYIVVPSLALVDDSGDAFPGWLDDSGWTFSTEAPTPPTITALSPVNGATDISTTNWVYTATFSEDVQKGSGSISIRTQSSTWFRAVSVISDDVTISGNLVTIDFTDVAGAETMEETTEYYIKIDDTALEDLSASNFAGMDYPDWTFTTSGPVDNTPPAPVSFNPSNSSEEIPIDQWNYEITFDEPIQLTNTSGVGFQLRDNLDNIIAEVFTAGISISGNTLSVDLNFDGELDGEQLDYSTLYHIEIESGYLEDLAGNDYAGFSSNTIWQFETVEAPDADPPTVVSLSPTMGSSGIAIDANLIIEFNEDVFLDNDAGTFELRTTSPDVLVESYDIFGARVTGDNSTTITIDPTNDLNYDTEYYFLIGGNDVIIDGADNSFAGFSSSSDWNFTTESEVDNTPPTITNFSPIDGATDVENDAPIILTFSEDIQLTGFGPIRIRRVSTGANLHEIDPASGQVSISGNVVTIQPTGGFLSVEEEVEVSVSWSSTPFEDLAGNDFNDLFSSTDYRFTVNNINDDMTAPVITGFSPSDDEIGVATDLSELTITFNEDIVKVHPGNIIIRNELGGILHQYFPVSSDGDVTISDNIVTIQLNETLAENTTYYVQIASNTFDDLAGNDGPTFTDAETWNFTSESSIITWNGSSWSNGSGPDGAGSDDIVINGNYFYETHGALNVNNLTINSGSRLEVDTEESLQVANDLINNGELEIGSGGVLMVNESGSITGNPVTIRRNTRYDDGRYSFVGSPVEQTSDVTDNELGSHIFYYDESISYSTNDGLNRWISMSGQLIPGTGYTQAFQEEIVFEGIPNTGTITYSGSYTEDTNDDYEGWNLVANPYTAAINVSDFISNNNIEGAVYIWDDNGSDTGRGSNSDYVVANGTVATNTTPAGGQSRYNGKLGVGQGFFVKLLDDSDTDIVFTENMRSAVGNEDEHFFRTENDDSTPYIRINLTSNFGLFKQAVLGYPNDISVTEIDKRFDARVFDTDAEYSIYTQKVGKALAIQGTSVEVTEIPVGINIAEAGNYSIGSEFHDFSNAIYLIDKQNKEIHDLSLGSYQFSSEAGQINDRFVITTSSTITKSSIADETYFQLSQKVLFVARNDSKPYRINVLDLSGKEISSHSISGSGHINLNYLPDGIYLISDGHTVNKLLLK